jgi:hypothetical protein
LLFLEMKKFYFITIVFFSIATQGQLRLANYPNLAVPVPAFVATKSPAAIVNQDLIGLGVTPFNIKFNGSLANALAPSRQVDKFSTNTTLTNLGFIPNLDASGLRIIDGSPKGMLLTTGESSVASGPNDAGNKTADVSSSTLVPPSTGVLTGDSDLAKITTGSVQHVSVVEFDFVATGGELNFDFVFASEEYREFSLTASVNDVFGFFLSGPGIVGNSPTTPFTNNARNIALVPSTTIPVSIFTVNNGTATSPQCNNCAFYTDNGTGITPGANPWIQYDGFTKVIRAYSTLVCGQTYHIKLAIGNVGDNLYDSGVFIKNFTIPPLQLQDNLGLTSNLDVCEGYTVTIASGLTVGSNTFVWKKDGVVISGQSGASLTVTSGGLYDLTVSVPGGCVIAHDDIAIAYRQPMPITDPSNLSVCSSSPPPYTFNINQNAQILTGLVAGDYKITYYNSNYQNAFDDIAIGRIPFAGLANYVLNATFGTIWVRIEELGGAGCISVKPFTLSSAASPSGSFSYPGNPISSPAFYDIALSTTQPVTTISLSPGGTYSATPAGLSINPITGAITPSLSLPGNYTINYHLNANIASGCPVYDAPGFPITIYSPPPAPIVAPLTYCQGDPTFNLTAISSGSLIWYLSSTSTTDSPSAPLPSSISPGVFYFYVSQTDTNGFESPRSEIKVTVNETPTASISGTTSICSGTSTNISFIGTPNTSVSYTVNGGSVQTTILDSAGNSSISSGNLISNTTFALVNVKNLTTNCTKTLTGSAIVTVTALPSASISGTSSICSGTGANISFIGTPNSTVSYTVNGGATQNISLDGIGTATLSTGNLSVLTTYSLVSVANTLTTCSKLITGTAVITISSIPSTATASTTIQPICGAATGTIVVTAPIGANLEYNINGGTYQSGTAFSNLAPGSSNIILVRNTTTGCVSLPTTVSVNTIPGAPATPVYTITQPTCTVATGSVSITPVAGLTYSFDGSAYSTTTTYAGLLAGSIHTITAQNSSNCISNTANPVLASQPLTPSAPAYVITNPTCTTSTGAIDITPVIGLTYSFDGSAYSSTTSYSGLAVGSTHTITAQNATNCISSSVITAAIGAQPPTPAVPSYTIVEPTCTTATGTISITAVAGLTYSFDGGTYSGITSYSGLLAGSVHSVTSKNATGCVSNAASPAIASQPLTPAAPAYVITNPTCATSTGTIDITPVAGLTYSFDGGQD